MERLTKSKLKKCLIYNRCSGCYCKELEGNNAIRETIFFLAIALQLYFNFYSISKKFQNLKEKTLVST